MGRLSSWFCSLHMFLIQLFLGLLLSQKNWVPTVKKKSKFQSKQRSDENVVMSVPESRISECWYWSWQGAAVSVVLVCCLTAFNIPGLLIVCLACVWGVSLWKKKGLQMTYWEIMRQLVGSEWEKKALPPSFVCWTVPLGEVWNLACCAKCLWSIITEGVLGLARLLPHLEACFLEHILFSN